MKKISRNYLLIGITLLIGMLIGYFISGSNYQQISTSNNQQMDSTHQHDEASEVWTCSMHPQIRQSEPGDCPICGMDLIPVTAGRSAVNSNPLVHEMTPEAVAMANINTTLVTGVSPDGEMMLTGKIKADEEEEATITAKFPGRIEQLYINFTGQVVRKGDRLVSIYSPELITAQRELLIAADSKESYPELYDAARRKLRLWKLSENQINQVESDGKVKETFTIYSDKGGVVTTRNISVGDYVNTGSVLFSVVDLSSVWVMLDAFESDLPYVKVGDKVAFTVAGVPGKTFNAEVNYIDPVINPETRAASVRAEITNPDGNLKPEMFVNARIETSSPASRTSLSIPRTALLWSGKRSIVYVKVPDAEFPSYEMREVTIGSRMGDTWMVESGLKVGEEIVTNGVFAIDAAAQLSGNYSMMLRPEVKTMEVPQAFRGQITTVANAYFEIKEALVTSNSSEAKSAANVLKNSLGGVKVGLLDGKPGNEWNKLSEQVSMHVGMLESAKDLEEMREHFRALSASMLEITELFGLEKDVLYKSYCPMAFDNEGAYWLSEVEDIRNPYFGDAMLTCGEVTETYIEGKPVLEKGRNENQQSSGVHNH